MSNPLINQLIEDMEAYRDKIIWQDARINDPLKSSYSTIMVWEIDKFYPIIEENMPRQLDIMTNQHGQKLLVFSSNEKTYYGNFRYWFGIPKPISDT